VGISKGGTIGGGGVDFLVSVWINLIPRTAKIKALSQFYRPPEVQKTIHLLKFKNPEKPHG